MLTSPPQVLATLRVMMLITPPIASEPYRVDMGPRMISIRSIAETGGMKLLLQTTDPTTIAFAQALLQGEGIDSFVLDVHTSILEGGLGFIPRRLMVAERDWFLASTTLRDNGLEVPR